MQQGPLTYFNRTGNELTPGVKYDFKFKDYAPWVFRNLREQFHIDAADYMVDCTTRKAKTNLLFCKFRCH